MVAQVSQPPGHETQDNHNIVFSGRPKGKKITCTYTYSFLWAYQKMHYYACPGPLCPGGLCHHHMHFPPHFSNMSWAHSVLSERCFVALATKPKLVHVIFLVFLKKPNSCCQLWCKLNICRAYLHSLLPPCFFLLESKWNPSCEWRPMDWFIFLKADSYLLTRAVSSSQFTERLFLTACFT